MKKECFTCNKRKGDFCNIKQDRIRLTDGCDNYDVDKNMMEIRIMLRDWAREQTEFRRR